MFLMQNTGFVLHTDTYTQMQTYRHRDTHTDSDTPRDIKDSDRT